MTNKIDRAFAATSACETAISKAQGHLEMPRTINAMGIYVDRFTVDANLRSAVDDLVTALRVLRSVEHWPNSLDYDGV
jgi:hypothetical protein